MKPSSETSLVRTCLQYLQLRGVLCWRQNQGAVVAESRGVRRFVRFTSRNGISDILGVLPGGRFLAVECKVRPNKPTLDQEAFLSEVRALGGVAVVAYGVEDLEFIR